MDPLVTSSAPSHGCPSSSRTAPAGNDFEATALLSSVAPLAVKPSQKGNALVHPSRAATERIE